MINSCNTHLSFHGNCEEAFRFYAEALQGSVSLLMTWGNSPMAAQVPPESHSKVMHATLKFPGGRLSGADALPGAWQRPGGFEVLLNLSDFATAERIFNRLAEDGSVRMQLQSTFWTEGFGMVTDRFGIPWMLNCEAAATL